MKINRAASIPLVTHDPFFSIWSPYDHLYDGATEHWCGKEQNLNGYVTVDGKRYAFLGYVKGCPVIPQKSVEVTATATEYIFENEKIVLKCRFTSPLLLDDMVLVSRPCTYIDLEVEKKDAKEVFVEFSVSDDVVHYDEDVVAGYSGSYKGFNYAYMGKVMQSPLCGSGDSTTINWGYAYLACKEDNVTLFFGRVSQSIRIKMELEDKKSSGFIFAYDDMLSINYFGQWRKAYWTEKYATILDAIEAAFKDKEETLEKAKKLDQEIEERAHALGGESYAFLCNMSYRQAISGHKLITDEEGNILFLSKENNSNGCIGTVDVSYPSIPLFLLYNTEYVKGMLRPIFKFASCDVWTYDFAPHDVGRYPYAWGQVYGFAPRRTEEAYLWKYRGKSGNGVVFPPLYMYPADRELLSFDLQMPVEECGNMLIMMAVVCRQDGNAEFAKEHWDVLKQWTKYLIEFGADPGEQLCTDDFAGHLAHNVNLSVKAIMGIESFAMLAEMLGETKEAEHYHKLAKEMAADWEARAYAGDHYKLVFDNPDSWSLKYNLVWDKLWGSGLFSEEVYEKELAYYVKMQNAYGTPLDSRSDVTKSDWLLWCASLAATKEQREALIKPIADYLENAPVRVPFGDYYHTESGHYCEFKARTVQGGIFMPMLFEK